MVTQVPSRNQTCESSGLIDFSLIGSGAVDAVLDTSLLPIWGRKKRIDKPAGFVSVLLRLFSCVSNERSTLMDPGGFFLFFFPSL